MKTKQDLRNYIKELFISQDREELREKDGNILEKLQIFLEKIAVQNICIYESMNDEVDTLQLIKYCRGKGIKVYTPQMIGETEMILVDEDYEIYEKEIDIFIVPGRAFNQDGKRLGRGKGYYDRFLSQGLYKTSKKLGLCYSFQMLENIPTQSHDINMDVIINDVTK